MALTKSGEVYGWGHNRVGQLGNSEKCFISVNPNPLFENPGPVILYSNLIFND